MLTHKTKILWKTIMYKNKTSKKGLAINKFFLICIVIHWMSTLN